MASIVNVMLSTAYPLMVYTDFVLNDNLAETIIYLSQCTYF